MVPGNTIRAVPNTKRTCAHTRRARWDPDRADSLSSRRGTPFALVSLWLSVEGNRKKCRQTMASTASTFHEANLGTRIRDLGLTIAGTDLESILHEFERELASKGVRQLQPRFYLSTEWGVPFGTVAIAIPFYLARRDLTDLHAQRVGHIEGNSRQDILRYLRHEMGHVVNYAYRLSNKPKWIHPFAALNQPHYP